MRGLHRLSSLDKLRMRISSITVCTGQILFDPSGSLDKIHRIIIMFLNTRSHSQYIRVENDIKKMEKEIEYRTLVVRKEALEDVKTARAHGDLSENFEYHAAKREKNRNESRIRYLQRMIKTAKIISDESADDEVGVNNIVELFYEDDETTEKIKLVTTVRGDSLEGLISIESPLGKALLGHKAGDRVLIEVNSSVSYYVRIKSIENSDDSKDEIQPY